MPRSRDPKLSRRISAPLEFRASRATVGGEEVAIFSFPLLSPALPAALSEAERAIALALIEGLSNAEIATARRTSVRTVANQIASLFGKLGVCSRAEAILALSDLQRS